MYKYLAIFLLFLLCAGCRTLDSPGKQNSLTENADSAGGGSSDQASSAASAEGVRDEESGPDWLVLAQEAWFTLHDRDQTDYCLDRVDKKSLGPDDRRMLYQLLCRLVYTSMIPLDELGFPDRNISALYVDGDDLWMGTWTGGIARYSIPLEEITVLRDSTESLRVEKISDFEKRDGDLLIAGYSDLYRYEKRSSLFERSFPEEMERVNNLARFKGKLYASTVNKGLWVENGRGGWSRVGKSLSGLNRINTLMVDNRDCLLIGTASDGVLSFDGRNFTNLRTLYPSFMGRNITSLSEENDILLAGTYGEGCYVLDRSRGELRYSSVDGGDFSSNYVLCTYIGGKWLFAGTLGGGLYALDRNNWEGEAEWIPLGLGAGLKSLDAAALTVFGNYLYVSLLGQGILLIDEEIIEKAI